MVIWAQESKRPKSVKFALQQQIPDLHPRRVTLKTVGWKKMNNTSNQLVSLFDPTTNFIKSQIELFHSAATQFVEIVSVEVFSFVQHDSSWFGTQMKIPFFFPPDVRQIPRKLVTFQFPCTKAVTFTTNLKLNGNRLVTQSAVFRASRVGHDNHLTGKNVHNFNSFSLRFCGEKQCTGAKYI